MKPLRKRLVAKPGADNATAAETQACVDEIRSELNDALLAGLIHSGIILEGLALSPAQRDYYHGLGRVPKVALMLMSSETVLCLRARPATNNDPKQWITLSVDGDVPGGFPSSTIANVLIA